MQHLKSHEMTTMAISPEERAFFVELGARIAELRKTQGITQVQMAEALGVSQQTINSYEVARRRVPVSALPTLAKLFKVSIEELLGEAEAPKPQKKRGPVSKLQIQIEELNRLPRAKQRLASDMLEAIIQQQAS